MNSSDESNFKLKQSLPAETVRKVLALGALLVLLVLLGVALETKKSNPVISSSSLLGAVFVLLGAIAVILVPKIQAFLYKNGYRPNMPFIDSACGSGDAGTGDSGWIGNSGWGGDCDGGSGDCGGG